MSLGKRKGSIFGFGLTACVGCESTLGAEGNRIGLSADQLTEFLGLPITNSMITSWVISLLIVVFFQWSLKRPTLIPSRTQAMVEGMIEGLWGVIEPIVGKPLIRAVFPLLLCLFVFILIHNWSGLLPGAGSIGFYDEHGQFTAYVRPGNADLNMTYALTFIHLAAWLYFIIRFAGVKQLVGELFGNKASKQEAPKWLYFFLFFIFFFVGIIEVVSILLRNVTLPLRLFGNVFAGESLLHSLIDKGIFSFLVPVPFYFLETLIGLVQAFVFVLLVSIYIGLICNHGN